MKRNISIILWLLLLLCVVPVDAFLWDWLPDWFRELLCFLTLGLLGGCDDVDDITGGDPCESNPCENGGVCTALADDSFTCACAHGYTGDTCQDTEDDGGTGTSTDDCTLFPANNIWNTRIDSAPVHANSDAYVASIGSSTTLHPDFGSGGYGGSPTIGIPYVEVTSAQDLVDIVYTAYGDESDPGPMPIPLTAPIEGGPSSTGDRHVIAWDTDNCMLYELFYSFPTSTTWEAASGAVYDLTSNELRPDGWTSADAAGLPILPGLLRYEEVAAGSVNHAIRFTAAQTQSAYVWPARHKASSLTDTDIPPMGQMFRLKSDYDMSGFDPFIQVILTAFQQYGLILADNGSDWFVSGAPSESWDNELLRELKDIPGSAFEAVDLSGFIIDPDSGEAAAPP